MDKRVIDNLTSALSDEKALKEYRPIPFWSWNDKLDVSELRRQIRWMKEQGFGGYFMHARSGLITDYLSNEWFDCIEACIDEGKRSVWTVGLTTKTAGQVVSSAVNFWKKSKIAISICLIRSAILIRMLLCLIALKTTK